MELGHRRLVSGFGLLELGQIFLILGLRLFVVVVLWLGGWARLRRGSGDVNGEAAAILQHLLQQRRGGFPVVIVLAVDEDDLDFRTVGRWSGDGRGSDGRDQGEERRHGDAEMD
jgi:hypothetical protein